MDDFFLFGPTKRCISNLQVGFLPKKKKKERNNNHLSKLKNVYMVRKIAFVQQGLPLFLVFFSLPLHFASSKSFQSLTS